MIINDADYCDTDMNDITGALYEFNSKTKETKCSQVMSVLHAIISSITDGRQSLLAAINKS